MKKSFLSFFLVAITSSWSAMAETQMPTNDIGQQEKKPSAAEPDYQLEQVVMLSRHGIRAPLIGYGSALETATPNPWVTWQTKGGHLTLKGGKLEGLFAQYLDYWLYEQGLIPVEACPQNEVLIYTNSLPRTVESGKSFAVGAFPNCDVVIHYLEPIGKMDNTFNPIIRSPVDEKFIEQATQSIQTILNGSDISVLNERLKNNFQILEKVLNYGESKSCQKNDDCHLSNLENTLTFTQNEEPKTTGSIRLGTGAADSFILQYYEGYPTEEVAWGKIKTPEEWQAISDIKNLYTDLLFTSPVIAKEAATPLVKFIQNSFTNHGYQHPLINKAQEAKFTLLVGHDSNIASVLSLLNIKPYQLEGQYEKTPISGKVSFQRWKNKTNDQDLIKIEYIYQTADQLRNGSPLTKDMPPKKVVLEMKGCPIDKNGFCPLEKFDQVINKVLQ